MPPLRPRSPRCGLSGAQLPPHMPRVQAKKVIAPIRSTRMRWMQGRSCQKVARRQVLSPPPRSLCLTPQPQRRRVAAALEAPAALLSGSGWQQSGQRQCGPLPPPPLLLHPSLPPGRQARMALLPLLQYPRQLQPRPLLQQLRSKTSGRRSLLTPPPPWRLSQASPRPPSHPPRRSRSRVPSSPRRHLPAAVQQQRAAAGSSEAPLRLPHLLLLPMPR